MMYLVSIQGERARSFYFKNEDRRILYRNLRSFLDRHFLLINSPFKTDLLYESEKDHNDYLIKLFYKAKRRAFSETYLSFFYRTTSTRDSLESFFNRIIGLDNHQNWQSRYLAELGRVVSDNPNNPILHKIIACYAHFDNQKYTVQIPTKKSQPDITVTPENARGLVMRLLSRGESN
ncbi:MAG: hypothetical protein R3345_13970 [Fulvivirga sp.]|nr:hypothetical protein [Fulvivirga sp.]